MSPPRMRHARALVLSVLVFVLAGPHARAVIKPRRADGQIVFTSRPDRKPGTAAPQIRPEARRKAPPSLRDLIRDVSDRYDLDPGLVSAVISVESAFDSAAVSPKGARGLMQLMPQTARAYGVRDVHDPRQNVEGGVAYLRDLTKRYKGNLKLALAAYNAGPAAVTRAGGVPRYRETLDYLEKIEARYGRRLTSVTPALVNARRGRIRASVDENGNLFVTNRPRGRRR